MRFLDTTPSQLLMMNNSQLLSSIRASEGRIIVSELISKGALFDNISNAELAAAFGADLLLLNLYDVNKPAFLNIDSQDVISKIREYTGRPVGINLEPVDKGVAKKINFPEGRLANPHNALKAYQQGVNFIVVTGNPRTGVTGRKIIETIKEIKQDLGERMIIMAGKMHGAGVEEDYLDQEMIGEMVNAGAEVILLPIAGTVPGLTVEELKSAIRMIHQKGALVMNALGTSQESADQGTIKQLALNSKISGADLHHIGDAGYGGMAIPENIMAFSIAIRGRRHTYKRIALSLNR